jgi:EmrB/QacA subfamily drug resistance transporter
MVGQETHTGNPTRWRALAILVLAQFLLVLDDMVVNIALPSIQRDLDFTAHGLVWVVDGYVLAYGGLLLLGGRATDIFGRRRVFVGGLIVFGAASLASGLAVSEEMLIAARVLQGIGAAAASPAALALVVTMFTDQGERAKALGIWGAAAGLAGTFGVLLSGVITDLADWRWIFFINVPIIAVVLVLAPAILPKARRGEGTFDLLGAVTLTGSTVALVYGLLNASKEGWGANTLVTFGIAMLLFAAFVVVERRMPNPLVRLGFFRHRTRAAGYLGLALVSATVFTMLFLLTLYLQRVLGYAPLQAGLCYTVLTVALLASVTNTSKLIKRFGLRNVMVTGALVAAAGTAYLSQVPLSGNFFVHVAPGMVLFGVGVGWCLVPTQMLGTTDADATNEQGLASGLLTGSMQIGGALGLAALVAAGAGWSARYAAAGASAGEVQVATTEFALLASTGVLVAVSVLTALLLGKRQEPKRPQDESVPPSSAPESSGPEGSFPESKETWSARLDALDEHLDARR